MIKGTLTPVLYGLFALFPYAFARLMAPVVENQNPIVPDRRRLKLRPPGLCKQSWPLTADCVGSGFCVEVYPHHSVPISVIQRFEGTPIGHRI